MGSAVSLPRSIDRRLKPQLHKQSLPPQTKSKTGYLTVIYPCIRVKIRVVPSFFCYKKWGEPEARPTLNYAVAINPTALEP